MNHHCFLYMGLDIHTRLRSKNIVTEIHELGLSVTYDRFLQLENQLATAVSLHTQKKRRCVPTTASTWFFAVGAVNNLDHNASSTTATAGSFHSTGIILFHCPTHGTAQRSNQTPGSSYKAMPSLPESSITVAAVTLMAILQKCQSSPVLLSVNQILWLQEYTKNNSG